MKHKSIYFLSAIGVILYIGTIYIVPASMVSLITIPFVVVLILAIYKLKKRCGNGKD